jgi:alkylation response protein AidB-like acyl-CoA dehydrogenase
LIVRASGLAAEMLGASDAAFEMTAEYLKVRKQFGQLIGSFQSLQHRAAIMFTELGADAFVRGGGAGWAGPQRQQHC